MICRFDEETLRFLPDINWNFEHYLDEFDDTKLSGLQSLTKAETMLRQNKTPCNEPRPAPQQMLSNNVAIFRPYQAQQFPTPNCKTDGKQRPVSFNSFKVT